MKTKLIELYKISKKYCILARGLLAYYTKIKMRSHLKIMVHFTIWMAYCLCVSDYIIEKGSTGKTYSDLSIIPNNDVGLLLGAGKFTADGRINLYYKFRIDAALDLYRTGKIKFILISGDNSRRDYNEPLDFKNDLIAKGIPQDKIFLDFAGFRTLDSMIRAKEVFDLDSFTIISQRFHNERAIYLASKKGINAIGYNAKNVSGRYGLKTRMREYLARVKAVSDIFLGKKSKFLGPKIAIN